MLGPRHTDRVNARRSQSITLRELVAWNRLSDATTLGGQGAMDRVARRVHVVSSAARGDEDYRDAVILLDGQALAVDTYVVDLTLRWMSEAGAPLLIIVSPAHDVGVASGRLAERSGVLLLRTQDGLLELADALREFIEAPVRTAARIVVDTVDHLTQVAPQRGVDGILEVLERHLNVRVSLVGTQGQVVAGPPLSRPLSVKDQRAVQLSADEGHDTRIVHPVSLVSGEPPTFWLVADLTSPSDVIRDVTRTLLKVGGSYAATRLISDRLQQERDARARLGILNAIVATPDRPSPALAQQLSTLGWKTDGWISVTQIRVAGAVDPVLVLAMTDQVRAWLAEVGLSGPLIERPDGWTTWTIRLDEPAPTSYASDVAAIRRVLRQFVADRPDARAYAGLGRPYLGFQGLRTSLDEAVEASTIAQAGGTRTGVHHIDEVGLKRILVGWYTSEEFRNFAQSLLQPVLNIDTDGELISTLDVYLDNESSPTETAQILGIHRNTVVNRVARAKIAMAADLDDPDQRLAVQLACRAINLRESGQGDP